MITGPWVRIRFRNYLTKTFYKTQNYILGICALHFKLTGKMAKLMKKQTITFKETISNLLGVLGV